MPLDNGDTFAGFRIIRLLGSGGMGDVYLAQHPRLPRRDALKLLPKEWSADPEYRSRFAREADLASTLWHPNIVGVHDRGEYDGQLWISMDFVDGDDLSRLLTTRYPTGMPPEQVVTAVTAVASALDYAHKQGLLHRDVKPANIMLTRQDDEQPRVLLADFGIARDVNEISGLTETNMTVGTVAYSAPEQLMGDDIDGRADQYALAATAYHLLTGSQLYPHSRPAVVISNHLNSPPPSLADTRAELAALDAVLHTALEKAPADRFASCADFAKALAEHARGDVASAPTRPAAAPPRALSESRHSQAPTSPPSASIRPHRKALIAAGVAVITVLVIGATLLAWRPWRDGGNTSTDAQPSARVSSPAVVPPASTVISPNTRTTAAAPVVLPDVLPTNSGCRGDVVPQKDIEHKFLGPVRIFLTESGPALNKVGCVASVTAAGKVLPAIYIRVAEHFGFPSPATDATGNTFVTYNPGRYDGVLVLVPTADGFADIGWDSDSTASNPSYWGKLAIYYAELVGPGSNGEYTIRQSDNDCNPNCAQGTVTDQNLHWDGSQYVP
jgi:serine/threonine-protein kinase